VLPKTLGITGIGLLGGSIAIRARQVFKENIKIIGFSRNPDKIKALPQSKVFDEVLSYSELSKISECDLTIICTPVLLIPKVFKSIKTFLKSDAIVTDIGSTKYKIIKEISDSSFIGSHPMAGSEKNGFENSDPSILINATCVITPYNNSESQVKTVSEFWEGLGMKVIKLPPELHDEIVAQTSHSIHIISFLISYTLSESKYSNENFYNIYGKGLLDTTRISKSDPEMWYDIIATNNENILEFLEKFRTNLENIERTLKDGKNLEAIKKIMEKAKEFREKL